MLGLNLMTRPKCFISYSWDNDKNKEWVRNLATNLQDSGVQTFLDQWDVHPGMDLTKYIETCIRESDFVLLICTSNFAKKANTGKGGVGYEKSIVTGEIFKNIASPTKFIPILRKGNPNESLPSYLNSRIYIDFQNDDMFVSSMEMLLRHIYKSPKYERPPLGNKPTFSTKKKKQQNTINQPAKMNHIAKFKQIYDFAYSYNGMNNNSSDAEEFATMWMNQLSNNDFHVFKEVYNFAYSYNGMNNNSSDAKEFATMWMKQFAKIDFQNFKELYNFACSYNGMNKSSDDAKEFAINQLSNDIDNR